MTQRTLSFQAIALTGSTALAQVATAVMYVLAARGSDPADFGRTATAIGIGMAASGYLDFGTSSLWVRDLASGRSDIAAISHRAVSRIYIGVLAAAALVLVAVVVPALSSLWIAAPIALAQLIRLASPVPLRAIARADVVSIGVVAERGSAILVMLALLAVGVPAFDTLWIAIVVGAFVSTLLTRALTPRELRFDLRPVRPVSPYRGALHYGLYGVGSSSQTLDLAVLGAVAGPSATGVYGAVSRWTQPMGLLASAFSSASAPIVARAGSAREAVRALRPGSWLLGLAVLGCLVVVAVAPVLVPVLVGDQYRDAIPVLQLLALGTIPAVLNQPLATFLQSIGHDRLMAWLLLASIPGYLGLVALLGPRFGAVGTGFAFIATQTTLFVVLLVVLLRLLHRTREPEAAAAVNAS